MNKIKTFMRSLVPAVMILFLGAMVVSAASMYKLHTSPMLIFQSTGINDYTDAASFSKIPSNYIDMSDGDFDRIDFVTAVTSGATDAANLTLGIYQSPNGGTTWIWHSTITAMVAASSAAASGVQLHFATNTFSCATKVKLIPALTAAGTFYTIKIWAMPRND